MNSEYTDRVVRATVTRVEEYALYLTFEGGEVIVLVPDVSDRPTHLKEEWTIGRETTVKILRYVPSERLFKGSIREAQG